MHRFLELYQQGRTPTLPAKYFRELVGDETVNALLRAGILVRSAVANRYPCDAAGGGCPRRVIENFGSPMHPWVAVCGRPVPACADVPLTNEEVEEYRTSHEQFARAIRQLMGIDGPFQLLDEPYWDTVLLGELRAREDVHDVFLCVMTWHRTLHRLLAERMLARRPSIVFVPTSNGVSPEVLHQHAPGGHVVLGLVDDVVALANGKLVLRPAFEQLVRPVVARAATFCLLYGPDGRRPLTREEYEGVVERAQHFDLFLDATVPRAGKRFVGGKTDMKGVYTPIILTRNEASAVVELIARAVITRATALACLRAANVATPVRVVEIARKKLDVKLGHRYQWRSLHSITETHSSERSYVFKPPAGLRYAILAPAAD